MPGQSRKTTPDPVPARVPEVGDIVKYRLSGADRDAIQGRRQRALDAPPHAWGSQTHVGSPVSMGQQFPGIVVRTFDRDGKLAVNLQVQLDGTDTHWVRMAVHGVDPGQWDWPART